MTQANPSATEQLNGLGAAAPVGARPEAPGYAAQAVHNDVLFIQHMLRQVMMVAAHPKLPPETLPHIIEHLKTTVNFLQATLTKLPNPDQEI